MNFRTTITCLVLLFCLLLPSVNVHAQCANSGFGLDLYWPKLIPGANLQLTHKVDLLYSDNIVVAGDFTSGSSGQKMAHFAIFDCQGNQLLLDSFYRGAPTYISDAVAIAPFDTFSNPFVLTGYTNTQGTNSPELNNNFTLIRLATGLPLVAAPFGLPNGSVSEQSKSYPDSAIAIVGTTYSSANNHLAAVSYWGGFLGIPMSTTIDLGTGNTFGTAICRTSTAQFMFAGVDTAAFIAKIDTLGDTLWTLRMDSEFEVIQDIIETADGNFLLAGKGQKSGNTCPSGFLYRSALVQKVSPTGALIQEIKWENCVLDAFSFVDIPDFAGAKAFRKDPSSGAILLYGIRQPFVIPPASPLGPAIGATQPFFSMFDSLGNHQFHLAPQYYGGATLYEYDVIPLAGGRLLSVGTFAPTIDGTNGFGLSGIGYSAPMQTPWIFGEVFVDNDSNCIPDGVPFTGSALMEVQETGDLNLTGANGAYSLPSPFDTVHVNIQSLSSPYWEETCPVLQEVDLVTVQPVNQVNFGVRALADCPLLTVDIGTYGLRPCVNNNMVLHYDNVGTETAFSPRIELEIDPRITVQSATVPWETPQAGNIYIFELDTLDPGDFGSLTLSVQVGCVDVMGLTMCSEARIYPDSFCLPPDLIWDGSSLAVDASCQSSPDSVVFNVRNVGSGNMLTGGQILVVEDNLLRMDFPIQLNAGADTTFKLPSAGQTWQITALQVPGHPNSAFDADVLEGCGFDSTGGISMGYAGTLPLSDWEYFRTYDCTVVTNSYDPNDKRGYPYGVDSVNYIESEDDIEYKIRFQNTGTDTAFNVLVIDTLPPELDLNTLQVLGGSHSFSTNVTANGVLEFVFNNIELPDSGTDLQGSQGYVRIRLQQVPGNPPGTIIRNDANIFFDYNPAIVTNTYFHTIGTGFIGMVAIESEMPDFGIHVYPNPFSSNARVEIDGWESLNAPKIEIYDLKGRKVWEQDLVNGIVELSSQHLSQGMFLLRITDLQKIIANGKIICLE